MTRQVKRGVQVSPSTSSLVRILPRNPDTRQHAAPTRLSFLEAFGGFGLPLVLVTLIGLAWTTILLAFTLDANRVLNYVMDTSNLDNGLMWSIPELPYRLRLITSASLILTGFCYLVVAFDMLVWRAKVTEVDGRMKKILRHSIARWKLNRKYNNRQAFRWLHIWQDFTHLRGVRRKYWNFVIKCADLAMQLATLLGLHKSGLPPGFIYAYAILIVANAWTRAGFIVWAKHSAIAEVVLDSIFGSVIVVLFPLSILVFAYNTFSFDRATFAIYEEVLPFGSFERRARPFTDPVQISTVRNAVDVLRVTSLYTMILRLGMNIMFAARIESVVSLLVREGYHNRRRGSISSAPPPTVHSTAQSPVPRALSIVFILFGTLPLINSHISITIAHEQCKPYPTCIAHKYTWSSNSQCPCISMVDVDKAPKTFDEWENPIDITDNLETLAEAGELRNIQVINRKLQRLPDNLQMCTDLRILSLMYTGIEQIPEWASTSWTHLEFLHIEGKQGQPNIQSMPSGIFDRMSSLTFLHLGVHKLLQELPSLAGACNLRMVMLAHLFRIHEIPSLAQLTQLVRLELTYLATLQRLPDLSRLHHLQAFGVYRSSQVCCDGFLGPCSLTNPYCVADPDRGIPAAICLPGQESASDATMAVLQRFNSTVCLKGAASSVLTVSDAPTRVLSDECGGVSYRQCLVPLVNGSTIPGMCYNNRMQVLSCTADPAKQQVRRLQIERGVGPRCDLIHERWLGCVNASNFN